jgi:hypothetical protein
MVGLVAKRLGCRNVANQAFGQEIDPSGSLIVGEYLRASSRNANALTKSDPIALVL